MDNRASIGHEGTLTAPTLPSTRGDVLILGVDTGRCRYSARNGRYPDIPIKDRHRIADRAVVANSVAPANQEHGRHGHWDLKTPYARHSAILFYTYRRNSAEDVEPARHIGKKRIAGVTVGDIVTAPAAPYEA